MNNFNKSISATGLRIGEVRFSYANVLAPRANDDGKEKYSVQILVPKKDTQAKQMLDEHIEAAVQAGIPARWNGKRPPASKLKLPLRDGDDEYPDDPTYEGMWFFNASTSADHKPGVKVLGEDHSMSDALDGDDFYSGCWGAVVVNFFAYNTSGNMGVAAGLNNVIKTRDDERLGGGRSAEQDFGDMTGGSWLD